MHGDDVTAVLAPTTGTTRPSLRFVSAAASLDVFLGSRVAIRVGHLRLPYAGAREYEFLGVSSTFPRGHARPRYPYHPTPHGNQHAIRHFRLACRTDTRNSHHDVRHHVRTVPQRRNAASIYIVLAPGQCLLPLPSGLLPFLPTKCADLIFLASPHPERLPCSPRQIPTVPSLISRSPNPPTSP